MDIIEELRKLRLAGKSIEIRELLEKNKDVIYPPDYHFCYRRYSTKAHENDKFQENWRKSIGEAGILHKLLCKVNVDFSETEIYELVNSLLNNPPKNTSLNELQVSLSNTINKIINIYEQIIEEAQKFDLDDNKDGSVHFDYSLPYWINYFRSQMSGWQAVYHYIMLQPKKMILYAERTVELCTGESQNSLRHIMMLNNLAIYYRVVKDIEKERETRLLTINIMEAQIKQFGIPRDAEGIIRSTVDTYWFLGEISMMEGDLLNAERDLLRYLDLSESVEAHLYLARLYIDSGDLAKAEMHLKEADDKLDPNKEEELQSFYFTQKARRNYLTGISGTSEVNSAIALIEKHLEEKEYLTSSYAIETYFHVADSYMANLDFNEAKKYYSMVSEMTKLVNYHDFQRAECLMKLIQISCIEGEETEPYKMELDKLVEDYSQHDKMILYQQLAEATILKHTKGKQMGISRFKAQEIFEKIAHGKIYDINLHFFARFNYCELLLDAYQFYADDGIFEELSDEMEDLTSISKEKGLNLYYIDALILRSKKATLQKDLVSALEYLEEAQELADTRNLKIYQDRVKTEKQIYLQNLDSWNSMRKDDKIENLRLKQYLKFAQQNITK